MTREHIRSYYRFYGARHSILQVGYLVDFEVEGENGPFLPRMRSLSHLGFSWLYDRSRLMVWHNFVQKFEPHLRDTETLEPFYFDLLLEAAKKWHRQNPYRIVVESYLKLLRFEGRLHMPDFCYICEKPLDDDVALMQAFRPAHPRCIDAPALPKSLLVHTFETAKPLLLDDRLVMSLYETVVKGF